MWGELFLLFFSIRHFFLFCIFMIFLCRLFNIIMEFEFAPYGAVWNVKDFYFFFLWMWRYMSKIRSIWFFFFFGKYLLYFYFIFYPTIYRWTDWWFPSYLILKQYYFFIIIILFSKSWTTLDLWYQKKIKMFWKEIEWK